MKINILPQNLVNKIAAGEVIERPASVAKELLENAIDAEATEIDIEVERGGTELIRITDNGVGLAAEELPLAFLSHATSKLTSEEDLFSIHTLGFRGEALPSIGSVARVRMVSRPRDAAEGAEILVEGGAIQHSRACGAPEGTSVEVGDLFFNLPVRRKFLRSLATEMSHITEAITRVALAHPHVHFTLTHNGKEIFNLPPSENRAERIGTFFGRDVGENLISVSANHPVLELHGHITQPTVTRPNTKTQYCFLNGRFIRDSSINHAIMQAYQSLLPQRRFPAVFLWMTIDPEQVDVNVHPTKMEVRFRNSQLLHDIIYRTLRDALRQAGAIPGGLSRAPGPESGTDKIPPATSTPGSIRQAINDFFVDGGREHVQEEQTRKWRPPADSESPPLPHRTEEQAQGRTAADASPADAVTQPTKTTPPDHPLPQTEQAMFQGGPDQTQPPPRAFIQMLDCYILEETPQGIRVSDQHALHERLLYERIKAQLGETTVRSQRLLIPELIELSAQDFFRIMDLKDDLGRLGLEIDEFGERTIVVRAVPQMFKDFKTREFFDDLLGELSGSPADSAEEQLDALARVMACKAAVKAGQRLSAPQIRELLAMRDRMPGVTTCPHGRPVSFQITDGELETKFKRR